jgi:hypothetical protein
MRGVENSKFKVQGSKKEVKTKKYEKRNRNKTA